MFQYALVVPRLVAAFAEGASDAPDVAPTTIEVAAPPKLIVVAVVFTRGNVVWLVVIPLLLLTATAPLNVPVVPVIGPLLYTFPTNIVLK